MIYKWLKCEFIEKGMFSHELLINIKDHEGIENSFFVQKRGAEVNREKKLIKVRVIESHKRNVFIRIPTPQPTYLNVLEDSLLEWKND